MSKGRRRGGEGRDVLGGASYHALQSLNLSLCFLWVFLSAHLLLAKAAVVSSVRIVE